MASLKLDIVTAEKSIFSGEVDMVLAPGTQGQMGILPYHTPLMTALEPGELLIRKGDEEICLAVTGGFMEVRPDRVLILADAAEIASEIDVQRAEVAKQRAQQKLTLKGIQTVDEAVAQAALMRALVRLKVHQKDAMRRQRR
ncbi:MAG: F0F1 ATP synthase subunit epsilon [Chloroflexi bacterium]|nr:F0F1 ATP synthase subunit epsilon [Chloroflexota bacterium]